MTENYRYLTVPIKTYKHIQAHISTSALDGKLPAEVYGLLAHGYMLRLRVRQPLRVYLTEAPAPGAM
jgi:hypothetical protein